MLSLAACRCLFRLMRHCFLGRWTCLPVSTQVKFVCFPDTEELSLFRLQLRTEKTTRVKVACYPDTEELSLFRLQLRTEKTTRVKVACYPDTEELSLFRLHLRTEKTTRVKVACYPDTEELSLFRLQLRTDRTIQVKVVCFPDTEELGLLRLQLRIDKTTRVKVACHPSAEELRIFRSQLQIDWATRCKHRKLKFFSRLSNKQREDHETTGKDTKWWRKKTLITRRQNEEELCTGQAIDIRQGNWSVINNINTEMRKIPNGMKIYSQSCKTDKHVTIFDRSTWPTDGTWQVLPSIQVQNWPGSNGNEGVTPHSLITLPILLDIYLLTVIWYQLFLKQIICIQLKGFKYSFILIYINILIILYNNHHLFSQIYMVSCIFK